MMTTKRLFLAAAAVIGVGLVAGGGAANADTPRKGGVLNFVVASSIPSYDGHRETTFGVIHPIAPFYSLLIRVNPDNPSSPSDFQCDVCEGAVPAATDNGTRYTFKIRKDIKFHDGTPLTAHDVLATYQRIIFPKEGVPSARQSFFRMVEKVTAPDDYTIEFKLKFPSAAFMPALATPYNWIYSKKDLDAHGYNWHTKNINGTGPFVFVQHQVGAFVEGKRYAAYHHADRPFLDGFKAIQAEKLAPRMQAIRGGRADIEFRGFPPSARDDLVKALGDKITVQESDWNCVLLGTPNQLHKPFDDPRVRKALTLALDRWEASDKLSKIAIVRTVGGVVFPNHPLATPVGELTKLAGYGKDPVAAKAEAKKLLQEAGVDFTKTYVLNNRDVDQPYKILGTWMIDQWRQVDLKFTQATKPSGPFYDTLRKKKDFDVSLDFNCQSTINPIADITKFLGSSTDSYGGYQDQALEDLYAKIERLGDDNELRPLIRQFEARTLSDMAHQQVSMWWYRIVPHRSYVKGWKISPSHYLNQQLDNIWLDKVGV